MFEEKDGILTLGPVMLTPADFEDADFSNFAFCEMRELAEKMRVKSECLERPYGCKFAGVIPAARGQRTKTLLFA
ncbi:MAG: hypothetical protein HGB34_00195 [Candidatus Moranbacteria bacterium]|nr:hypothetical protein [Candidatus Moranbacteria bacterium]